jgi:hypothetical protein
LECVAAILTAVNDTWLKALSDLCQHMANSFHAAQIAADGIKALRTIDHKN